MWIIKNKVIQLVVMCLVISALYFSGMSGGFYFDDEWNILQNSALQINDLSLRSIEHAAISGTSGPLGRPIAMASFAVNYFLSGFDPFYFKITNLIIHLLTGLAVYVLAMGLARLVSNINTKQAEYLALLTAALWLLHPLNLTPVLYVVQRMTSLSALFVFWGLVAYVLGRIRLNAGKPYAYLCISSSFVVFLPLGLFSKENAALFPVYCLLIEWLFFRFQTPNKSSKILLITLFMLVLVLPGGIMSVYLIANPERILGGYQIRAFDLSERLMTESRVLMFYLKQIVLPVNSELGLFHDDISVSTSLLKPISTLFSILIILVSLIVPVFLRNKHPIFAFGILFYFAAHLMESTVLGLELVHEHRNYVASFSILFVIAYGLIIPIKNNSLMRIKYGVVFVALFYLGFTTFIRASVWGNPTLHPFEELRNHPNSPRVNYHVGKIFASSGHNQDDKERRRVYLEKASMHFVISAELSDSYTDGLFGLLLLQGIEGIAMESQYHQLLLDRLATGPFNANNYNYLAAYFKCINDGACKADPFEVGNLVVACKKNAHFGGVHASNILKLYSHYKSQVAP